MNIYLFNNTDFIAAETKEDAIKFYKDFIKITDEEIEESKIIQMTDQQLNNYIFYYFPVTEESVKTTFKKRLEELIQKNSNFPLFFASTKN